MIDTITASFVRENIYNSVKTKESATRPVKFLPKEQSMSNF
jgi:hypothetical protein